MALVKYPYHVKHNGVDYKPGEVIEVDEAIGHKLRGAVEVEVDPVVEKQRVKPRRKADKTESN